MRPILHSKVGVKRKSFDLRDVEGFGATLCARVERALGDSWRDEPYKLTEVHGLGFQRADRVARRLGVSETDKQRINAGAWHVLLEAEQNGHTCLPTTELIQQLLSLLQINLVEFDFDDRFYEADSLMSSARTQAAEAVIAAQTKIMLRRPTLNSTLPGQSVNTTSLYNDQRDALNVIRNQNMFVLLGGPGVGKTRLIEHIAKNAVGKVALCAPTGKAAKRIEELSHIPATTIHRLLEPTDSKSNKLKSFSHGFNFQRNRIRPLDANLVICDEASMLDVRLLADLMDALAVDCRLILVGDPFQLPSVGPGAVLRDLIAGHGLVPYVELMELKRQNPDLLIARNCQEIRWRKRVIVDNKAASDFFMLPYATAAETQAAVVEMVAERIPEKYGLDAKEIMVIAPLRGKGELASVLEHQQLTVRALNHVLRKRLNPDAENCPVEWVGDRVIQKSNNRDLDVVNGDTGTVIEADETKLRIAFDTPEREVEAERSEFDIELAYALTVHRAQGSQSPAVVAIMDPSGPSQYLMDASLLYTSISRAAEVCVTCGNRKAMEMAATRHRATSRWTRLGNMLRE